MRSKRGKESSIAVRAQSACEGKPCTATFVRAKWRTVRDPNTGKQKLDVPTTSSVKVKAVKPAGTMVGFGALFQAVELVQAKVDQENKVISGRCPGECACVTDEPDDDDFVYAPWAISIDFHLGGRDPKDPSDRVDYTVTFQALRAALQVEGVCKMVYV